MVEGQSFNRSAVIEPLTVTVMRELFALVAARQAFTVFEVAGAVRRSRPCHTSDVRRVVHAAMQLRPDYTRHLVWYQQPFGPVQAWEYVPTVHYLICTVCHSSQPLSAAVCLDCGSILFSLN
ncbi:MAG: hypothetical protein M5U01_39490 [Ardenticatenaceae bacterium]|nr:hypothetical protein [Ardenticatenaceae bacterium]HBY93096.1 hypothetical protein [Chloroflexota bacterium]